MLAQTDKLASPDRTQTAADAASVWADYFRHWPAGLPRRGVAVTCFDEQIPFEGFLTSHLMLVLERRTPDTVGARQVLLPYDNILAVKIVDPAKSKVFRAAGFEDGATAK